MGYDVHITRADEWSQNEGREIPREEWLELVAVDPQLERRPEHGDGFAVWSGPSKTEGPWIDWFKGNLFTKNPDRSLIAKMLEIAARLHAKVQGEDGEVYTSAGDWPENL